MNNIDRDSFVPWRGYNMDNKDWDISIPWGYFIRWHQNKHNVNDYIPSIALVLHSNNYYNYPY